jgi:hypothetical protein
MDEDEFDSLKPWRPFGTNDAMRADAQARRCTALAMALFCDLHRQLLAPHPEIPFGFELADFRELQRSTLQIAALLANPRHGWLNSSSISRALNSPTIVVGSQRLTVWEAHCEIIRRAIDYLENR